jgi:hypothetical protein
MASQFARDVPDSKFSTVSRFMAMKFAGSGSGTGFSVKTVQIAEIS